MLPLLRFNSDEISAFRTNRAYFTTTASLLPTATDHVSRASSASVVISAQRYSELIIQIVREGCVCIVSV